MIYVVSLSYKTRDPQPVLHTEDYDKAVNMAREYAELVLGKDNVEEIIPRGRLTASFREKNGPLYHPSVAMVSVLLLDITYQYDAYILAVQADQQEN